MPGADEATIRIVSAIAGLLGQVAYADHDYSEPEERKIREALGRVEGLGDGPGRGFAGWCHQTSCGRAASALAVVVANAQASRIGASAST